MKHYFAPILWVLILTFFFIMPCGCHKNDRNPSDNVALSKVTIGMGNAPKSLDPRLATDVASARVQQLIFNSLVKKNKYSEIVPDLAESWEMLDKKTYRFNIRHNVIFHDGSLLTTRDIKATFDAVLSETLASPRKSAYDKLASITIIDDYTIVFETTEPFAPFLINMVMGILPESEANKKESDQIVNPIGTGPFHVMEQGDDGGVKLTAWPRCFTGKPGLDEVEFRVIPDDAIRLMELEKGSIDFVENNVPADSVAALRQNPDLRVMSAPGTSYYYLGFNHRLEDHPMADVRVRHALALALNRNDIITHVLGGLASPAVGVLPEGHWAYNSDLKQIPFNTGEAQKLLDQAGFPMKEGKRFSIQFKVSQNKQSRKLAEIIQAQWGQIGVEVTLQSLEWGTFYEDVINGNFETYVLSWVGVTDPDIYHSIFHSDSVPPNGRNRGQYKNEALDKLLDEARIEMDQTRRADLYRQIQRIAYDDFPYISLWHLHNVAVMRSDIQGFELYPAGDLDSFSKVTRQ